jgi:hypothetical protein
LTRPSLRTSHGEVSIAIDGPEAAPTTVVLGHGAGAPMDSDYMVFFGQALAGDDVRVVRFNFPYMEAGKKTPGNQAVSEETFRQVADSFRTSKLVLGGKSYGGRIASHVVASGEPADGLLFLGYPLHAPGRPDRIRDAHLRAVSCPMLFVEGTRDPFCPLDTLERVRSSLSAPSEVIVVEDGDHSLKVRKSSGRSTQDAWSEAATEIERWLAAL